MFYTWLGIWLASSFAMIIPSAMFTWELIELSRWVLFCIFAGMVGWGGTMARACKAIDVRGFIAVGLPGFLVMRASPALALMGVWLAVLAFLFPSKANLLFLYVLLAGGMPALLSYLFFLCDVERRHREEKTQRARG